MGLIIDTNIFILAENGKLNLNKLSNIATKQETYIAAISAAELVAGIHLAKNKDARIRRSAFVENILSTVPILDFNESVARTYAELYAHFLTNKKKNAANVHDLQIAATAITHGFPILTKNTVDFKKIPGLSIESI